MNEELDCQSIIRRIAEAPAERFTIADVRRLMDLPPGVAMDLPSPDLSSSERDASPEWSRDVLLRSLRGESTPGYSITLR
jgi:hypothetical protein